jgi:hypothetical protein
MLSVGDRHIVCRDTRCLYPVVMATLTPRCVGVTAPSSLSPKAKASDAPKSQDYVTTVTRLDAERKKKVTWGQWMSADGLVMFDTATQLQL